MLKTMMNNIFLWKIINLQLYKKFIFNKVFDCKIVINSYMFASTHNCIPDHQIKWERILVHNRELHHAVKKFKGQKHVQTNFKVKTSESSVHLVL